MDPAALVLGACLLAGAGLFAWYLRMVTQDATRERLRAGVEEEEAEAVSLWRDAADLLQIARARELLASSPLARVLQTRLRQLASPWALPQLVLATAVPVAAFAGATHVVLGRTVATVIVALCVPLLLWWLVAQFAAHRVRKLEMQLPGLVAQMIAALRSGSTPNAALRLAAQSARPPIGPAIAHVNESIAIGVSPGQAWREWAALWHSRSCELFATAIRLKWEVGGDLSSLLEVILDQLEARRRRELRIRTLTSMARLSAVVLAALPVVLGGYTWYVNPALYDEMVSDPFGRKALLWSAALVVAGYFWLRRIARLES